MNNYKEWKEEYIGYSYHKNKWVNCRGKSLKQIIKLNPNLTLWRKEKISTKLEAF